MQLRSTSALALYVGSYLPLSLILLAQDLDLAAVRSGLCRPSAWLDGECHLPIQHPAWSLGALGICVACLAVTLWSLQAAPAPQRMRVSESKHVPADLINYVIPYVVSFMGLDFASPSRLIGFGVFFLWIFWITYRSGQILMNPVLIAVGWRLYEVKFSYLQSGDIFTGRALSRTEIEPNVIYHLGHIQDVMIVREQE